MTLEPGQLLQSELELKQATEGMIIAAGVETPTPVAMQFTGNNWYGAADRDPVSQWKSEAFPVLVLHVPDPETFGTDI